jgi:hypothetical protein
MSRRRNRRGSSRPPRRNTPRKRVPLLKRLLRNRYNPGSNWVSLGDLIENVKDTWFCFSHRLPPGTRLVRDGNGRIKGAATRWRGAY